MFQGRKKAVTFSYDDGMKQDIRLIQLLDQYGLKATFNLNSGLFGEKGDTVRRGAYVRADRLTEEEVKKVYVNHEVAVHTLTHPDLTMLSDREIIYQVEKDRQRLQMLLGREVVGMAYPGGGINYNRHVAQVIKKYTGIRYARTTVNTDSFQRQKDLYMFEPNVYHIMNTERLFETGRRFLESESEHDQILYVWGHSFELDIPDGWEKIERFFQMISGYDDIFYGTNREILL